MHSFKLAAWKCVLAFAGAGLGPGVQVQSSGKGLVLVRDETKKKKKKKKRMSGREPQTDSHRTKPRRSRNPRQIQQQQRRQAVAATGPEQGYLFDLDSEDCPGDEYPRPGRTPRYRTESGTRQPSSGFFFPRSPRMTTVRARSRVRPRARS